PVAPPPPAGCVCVCQRSIPAEQAPAAGPVPQAPLPAEPLPHAVLTQPRSEETQWYGGPAIAADVLSFAVMLYGATSNKPETLMLGLMGYALGAPINHLAHGHGYRALDSLGIRAIATGLSAFVILEDVVIGHCDNDAVKCGDPTNKIFLSSVFTL